MWDMNLNKCHFNSDVTRDNSRGSCSGYPEPGYGRTHCDAGRGRSGFTAPGTFGDDGPGRYDEIDGSFWEWLLWQEQGSRN